MWQAILIFQPHKNVFTDLSDFNSSYNAIMYMFYTCVPDYFRKKSCDNNYLIGSTLTCTCII